ncbi:MAG TPA: 2-dehydropantoate 2-reductase [Bacilli bacterium]|nr:2-dehydropantoate 2-reductase [Bacilli bacterium]
MKVAIIGPGAIGRLLAYVLHGGGHTPVLVCRREAQRKAFLEEGLTCFDPEGVAHHVPVQAVLGNKPLPNDVDGVILTVKSYDTAQAGEMLRGLRQIPVLSLQNGLGNGETLAGLVPPQLLALGLTTHGAMAEGDTRVLYKGRGSTIIGDWVSATFADTGDERNCFHEDHEQATTSPASWWKLLFDACGHAITLTDDIRTEVWRKAMVNIGINPFTALLGVPNGALLEHPEVLAMMKETVEEAERVASAEGVHLTNSFSRVIEVCQGTAQNLSSMLQDIRKGRQTEIESLCGVVVELGRRHRLPTPWNERLYHLVKRLESIGQHLTITDLQMKKDRLES